MALLPFSSSHVYDTFTSLNKERLNDENEEINLSNEDAQPNADKTDESEISTDEVIETEQENDSEPSESDEQDSAEEDTEKKD